VARPFIHPTAIVEEGAELGEDTRIWHFVHVRRGARVGRGCNIGKGVYVDEGVRIGDHVKIQNFVSVYRGVTVEDGAFLGPSATLTNDLYPRARSSEWRVVPTVIEEGASIGANATIVCGVRIGRYAMVGAGAVVTRDVPPHGLVVGVPARLVGFVCGCGAKLGSPISVQGGVVTFRCGRCGSQVEVQREAYERMILERASRR